MERPSEHSEHEASFEFGTLLCQESFEIKIHHDVTSIRCEILNYVANYPNDDLQDLFLSRWTGDESDENGKERHRFMRTFSLILYAKRQTAPHLSQYPIFHCMIIPLEIDEAYGTILLLEEEERGERRLVPSFLSDFVDRSRKKGWRENINQVSNTVIVSSHEGRRTPCEPPPDGLCRICFQYPESYALVVISPRDGCFHLKCFMSLLVSSINCPNCCCEASSLL